MEAGKRWRWLGVEFIVIVLGVLSALFVDTWVEDRKDAERAETYRGRLITDIQQDITNLDAVMSYFSKVRSNGLLVIEDLEGRQTLADFTLMFAAFNAAEEWGFDLQSSTYMDLQNTGSLPLIEDVALRMELAEYYRQASNVAEVWDVRGEYRQAARGIIPNALQAAIHENCSVDPLTENDVNILPLNASASADDECGLNPGDFDLARAAQEYRSDPDIPRHLRYRISEVRVAIALFDGQKQMAENLLRRLESNK